MIASTLDRIELVTAALDCVDRTDLEKIEKLMTERQLALDRLQSDQPLSEAHYAQLRQAHEVGARLRTKLLLTRAGLRNQLSDLFHSSHLLHAFNELSEPSDDLNA
jgi:hypothetical protein